VPGPAQNAKRKLPAASPMAPEWAILPITTYTSVARPSARATVAATINLPPRSRNVCEASPTVNDAVIRRRRHEKDGCQGNACQRKGMGDFGYGL
jgi:hypothetical protein